MRGRRGTGQRSSSSTARRPAATGSAARRVLASQELGEDSAEKRPSVQIGDPVHRQEADRGLARARRARASSSRCRTAAPPGSPPSLAEMARDGAGVDVHLDRVPLREDGLEPWEIMISESQERMVAVVAPGAARAGRGGCSSAGSCHCAAIGEVTETGELRAFFDGELVGEIPADVPHRRVPALRGRAGAARRATAGAPTSHPVEPRAEGVDLRAVRPARRLAHRPPARARRGRAAADGRRCRGLAVSLDGPPLGERDPFRRRARGRARTRRATSPAPAASRSALTDCLNFGNPEKPEIGWELARGDRGHRAGGRGARHPGRLRQRLALQRDRRTRDPADAGRRLRRARARRARRCRRGWREGDVVLACSR